MSRSISLVLGNSWQLFQEQFLATLPHVLASLLVLLIGLALGAIVRRLGTWLLAGNRVDQRLARLGLAPALDALGVRNGAVVVARFLQAIIVFVAGMLALYSLDARLASDLAERFFVYLPHFLVAVAILGAGVLLARFLGRSALIAAVNSDLPAPRLLAGAVKTGIMVLAFAIAFEHLGIGRVTLLTAFGILFGGATLAASLALGLGLQDVVRHWAASRHFPDPSQPPEHETIRHW